MSCMLTYKLFWASFSLSNIFGKLFFLVENMCSGTKVTGVMNADIWIVLGKLSLRTIF